MSNNENKNLSKRDYEFMHSLSAAVLYGLILHLLMRLLEVMVRLSLVVKTR